MFPGKNLKSLNLVAADLSTEEKRKHQVSHVVLVVPVTKF